jgi:hypothetical protein
MGQYASGVEQSKFDVKTRGIPALSWVTVFELDETKSVPVSFSVGYHYLPAPGKSAVNRLEPMVMFHFKRSRFAHLERGSEMSFRRLQAAWL